MSTWVAALIETQGRRDFWDLAREQGVEPLSTDVPARVLVDFEPSGREAAVQIAQALSAELSASCLAFAAQTNADVYELHAFERGARVRRLAYSRDGGGWFRVEGEVQPWERAFFFDEASTSADSDAWPDMLWDELADEDVARYEAARRAGDASAVLDLLHPSSTGPLRRLCDALGVSPDAPLGRWRKPGLGSRLLRR
ncbi:hypothetical protein [Nannocystis punicea]|uniref:Uncharacterized protein n=1 Tax=Nannocystis punicea TaxID=2995304 RepID=A0ABY7HB30_9BACT|nr:hypothetical protein [Nannocystis poenicansa]WAS96462.1 hypothetical protein O0S08_09910 [Nannocystis poenicansa]